MFSHAFKTWSKFLAAVLAVTLLFTNFNGSLGFLSNKAYAAQAPKDEQPPEDKPELSALEKAQLTNERVMIESESDESTNVYQNPDGTVTADSFGGPVNYYDENGELQKIENEIMYADTEKQSEGVKYTNKSGMVSVELPGDVVSEKPVRLKYKGYAVEICPIGDVSYAQKRVNQAPTEAPTEKPQPTIEKTASVQATPSEEASPTADPTTPSTTLAEKTPESKDVSISPSPTPIQTPKQSATQNPTQTPAQPPPQTPEQTAAPTQAPAVVVPEKYKAKEIIQTYDQKGEVAKFPSEEERLEAIDKKAAIEKIDSVKYRTGYADTDIQYTPLNMGVKEDIILNEYTGRNAFDFRLYVGDLVPQITETMNIEFTDPGTKEVVGIIPSPYMHDSFEGEILEEDGDHISEAVTYTLKKTGNKGEYILTVTADKTFLEDEDTVYPVTIDPSYTYVFDNPTNEMGDSFVSSRYPNNNYDGDTRLRLGKSGDFGTSRAYVRIPGIRDIIQGRTVLSANIRVYEDYGYTSNATFDIHRLAGSFMQTTVKWTNCPSYYSTIYASKNINGKGYYTFNVKNMVQQWVNNTSYYPGFVIKYRDDVSGIGRYRRFVSTNAFAGTGIRLTVTYEDQAPPTLPTNLYTTQSFSGPTGSITLRWSGIVDQPKTAGASGIDYYRLAYRRNNGSWVYVNKTNPSATSHTFSGLLDNSEYDFAIKTYDNNGNVSDYAYEHNVNTPDKTGPTAPTVTVTPGNWTNDDTPKVAWSGITDEGDNLSNVQYKIYPGGVYTNTGYSTASGSKTLNCTAFESGQYKIYIRGMDSAGNTGAAAYDYYYLDKTAPEVSISSPLNNHAVSGIVYITATVDNETGLSGFNRWTLEYGYGTSPASWIQLATGTNEVNNAVIYAWDTTGLNMNSYYSLRLRAKDAVGNESVTPNVRLLISEDSEYVDPGLQIDTPQSQAVITVPEEDVTYQKKNNGGVNGLSPGKLYVNNKLEDTESSAGEGFAFNAAAVSALGLWRYPESSIVFLYAQAKDEASGELYSTHTYQALEIADTFETDSKIENLTNTQQTGSVVKLTNSGGVYAQTGSFESILKQFAGDVSYVDLTVDQTVGGGSVAYEISVDGGDTWQAITPVSTDGGTTTNPVNRKYFTELPVGDSVKIRANLTKSSANVSPEIDLWSIDVRYTTYATAVLVNNSFTERSRGVANLVFTDHDQAEESIRLAQIFPTTQYYTSGTVECTKRFTSNDTIAACLQANSETPAGTGITYEISANGGTTWQQITPGNANDPDDWIDISNPGTVVILRATLTGNGTVTPSLLDWTLCVKEKIAGQPHEVKLVDEPDNLSTLTGANYMTLLRWEESETEGVAYNVYRSNTPYFEPSPETLAAEGITENSWSDFNLNYGETFYYKVTAVKTINERPRESLPSNEAFATVVDENEVQKMLGLQNYWSYAGFETGSGTGYINVANGNLAYITTDMVISGPFFASVMRRTYNTLATTKTPMGYGWDFSFNTCLMKEYNANREETGMILKDGDGSLHRFAKNGATYESAKGTFMKLTYDDGSDEWQIQRKDNITYHFDGQSMKLKSFTDNNGNALSFTYDERGNLDKIENTVGEKVTLDYYVAGAVPEDPDYEYVNEHPDMMKSITWTEDRETSPVSITYNYAYNDADKLTSAATTIELDQMYEEEFHYDEDDALVRISDPANRETNIEYTASGRVHKITDAHSDEYTFAYADLGEDQNRTTVKTVYDEANGYGPSIKYEYHDNGLVYKKTDKLGNSISYTHNGNYLVTGMSYQNYVNGGTTPQTISYGYGYDGNGNVTSVSGPGGSLTTYGAYNAYNKPSSVSVKKTPSRTVTTSYGYDTHGNLLTTTDPEGRVTTNTYATRNGSPGYLIEAENAFGGRTRYTYDTKGRVTHVKEYDADINFVRTVSAYTYDRYGRTDTVTDGMGNTTDVDYDILGRQTRVEDPNGNAETFVYDIVGNLKRKTDRKGNRTEYSYDSINRLTRADFQDDSYNTITYGEWDSSTGVPGNDAAKVTKTDGTGIKQIEYYDMAGRLIRTAVDSATVSALTTAQYEYDLIGNCTQVTDGEGRVTEIRYNALGQKTKTIIDPGGENIETTCAYDLLGNQTSVTDGDGYTTTYAYDDISRLTSVHQGINTTSYAYDIEEGGVIKNRTTDAKGQVTEAWFDELGRKVRDFNRGNTGDGDDASGEYMRTLYTYNANGQPRLVTRNDGTKEKYTYDSLGKVSRVDYYEAGESTSGDSGDYIVYEYDDNGNVTLESVHHGSANETTSYDYDSMNRVVQMIQGTIETGGVNIDYAYDDADRLTGLSYTKDSSARNITYGRDGYGRVSDIRLNGDTVRTYTYSAGGDLHSTKDYRDFLDDGTSYIKTAYQRNDAGLIDKITYTDFDNGGTGVKKEEYSYTFNGRGYITDETAYTNYGTAKTVEKEFVYDAIGRLTSATIGSDTRTYTYDAAGNRTTKAEDGTTYAYNYNQFNQLTSVQKGSDANYASYIYDSRGNQTREQIKKDFSGTTKTVTTEYDYNLQNRMSAATVTATGETTQTVSNKYNAKGQRIKKLENGGTTNYYYVEDAVLFTTTQHAFMLTENILDPDGTIVASKRFPDEDPNTPDSFADEYYFYNYDIRGSVTSIIVPHDMTLPGGTTLQGGNPVAGYEYDEYGNLEENETQGFLNETTYTGSVTDKSTGLQYMSARYYDAENGRFLTQDTYTGNPYDPWTQHLYSYCGNNPTSMVDPTGHDFFNWNKKPAAKKSSWLTGGSVKSGGGGGSTRAGLPDWLANIFEKTPQHKKVQNAIATKFGGRTDVYIKGASSNGRDDTYGKADVISYDNQIWEVKPISDQAYGKGRTQINRYIKKYKENYGITLRAGEDPALPPLEYEDATSYGHIVTTWEASGVVYYDYKKEGLKQPAIAIEPETEKQPQENVQPLQGPSIGDVVLVGIGILAMVFSGGACVPAVP